MHLPGGRRTVSLSLVRTSIRRFFTLDIILFCIGYLLISAVTVAVVVRQHYTSEAITRRYSALLSVQKLERASQEQALISNLAAAPHRDAEKSFAETITLFTTTHASLTAHLMVANNQEMFAREEEQRLAKQIRHTFVGATKRLAVEEGFILPHELSRDAIEPSNNGDVSAVLREQVLHWRALIQSDLTRLQQSYDTLGQLFGVLFVVQILLVVGAFLFLGQTYVSPAFRRLFRSLQRENRQLQNLDVLKSEFLSIASHQLRTPLSELKWTLTLLGRDVGEAPITKQRELIDQAKASTTTMIRLVTDLLNIARIEQNRLEYNPVPNDLVPLVKSVVRSVASQAKQREIDLEATFAVPKAEAKVDALLFKQVIQNLVENAIQYNHTGGKVEVSVAPEHRVWVVSVIDNGDGIQAHDLRRLFTKFFRAEAAVKAYPDGSGLGLYFAKRIVEKHGGRISAKSKAGEGTAFRVVFPK